MSSTNFSSLVSSTINTLALAKNSYHNVSGDRGLPGTFHKAGQGLLLIEEALQHVKSQIHRRSTPRVAGDTISSLEACYTKAKLSEGIFMDVSQAPETERFEYYKKAVGRQGESNLVELLVMGVMHDVCDLAKDRVLEAVMSTQVKVLREAIERLSKMEPSVPIERPSNPFSNHGSGSQFNATGGTQNNNTGSGNQFPGATFSGSVQFGSGLS